MSQDGTRVLPPQASPTLTDSSGVTWSISYPSNWALKDGVATNGHATEILFFGGEIYCKSPTGGIWWKYLGGKAWQKLDTTDPGGPQQQFPLSATAKASIVTKITAIKMEVSALGS